MSGAEPLPPWVMHPEAPYHAFWVEAGDAHVSGTWRPFWDGLTEEERRAYLGRFPPRPGWQRFLDDVAMDQEFDRIDAEDIASGVLQPNGLPWPRTPAARPSLWRRLLGLG